MLRAGAGTSMRHESACRDKIPDKSLEECPGKGGKSLPGVTKDPVTKLMKLTRSNSRNSLHIKTSQDTNERGDYGWQFTGFDPNIPIIINMFFSGPPANDCS